MGTLLSSLHIKLTIGTFRKLLRIICRLEKLSKGALMRLQFLQDTKTQKKAIVIKLENVTFSSKLHEK